jgi:hypothetical protein
MEKDFKIIHYHILALKFGLPVSFVEKRTRRVPRFFDEEATDELIIDAETKFVWNCSLQ